MTPGVDAGGSRRFVRYVLSALAAFDAVVLGAMVHDERIHPRQDAIPSAVAHGLSSLPVVAVLVTAAFVALVWFARARGPLLTGCIALGALGVLAHVDAGLRSGPQRTFFVVGATLAGWLFGLLFARRLRAAGAPPGDDEALAEAGAVAGLAATYVDAGLSKLSESGLIWADQTTLRATILVNHPVDDASPLGIYTRALVERPWASQTLSLLTLAIQLGAVLYVLGPRMRMLWGTLLLAFHLNVLILTHIAYVEAMVLLLAFSYPWPKLFAIRQSVSQAAPASEALSPALTRAASLRMAAWVGLAVGVAWLVHTLRP